MDFNIVMVNRIVDAINKVNTSIQKLGDYVDYNTYNLNADAITEISSVSAILASVEITTLLRGLTASIGSTTGVLNVVTNLIGNLAAAGGGSASLDVALILGSGSTAGISGGDATLRDVTRELISSAAGNSTIEGNMNVGTELIGSIGSTSHIFGSELQSPPSDL